MTEKISYRNEVLRKLIHLSSLWMLAAIYLLNHNQAILLFMIMLVGMILFEVSRRYNPFVRKLTDRLLGGILRRHETDAVFNLTGAFYVVLAVLMALILFSKAIVISAVAIMLLADTAAALVGRKFGYHPIHGKSWEGTAAFFVIAATVLYFSTYWGLPLNFMVIVCVAASLAIIELYSDVFKMDDNLLVVLGAGFLLTIFQ